jgi:UDP-N-acetylmuramoyl-tripeptide--D-alanyl-D-alanine ligase
MNLTLAQVSDILGLPKPASDVAVTGYSIDSRTIQPGQLFFAIRGPRFDGHDFVREVLEKGAAGAVVEKGDGLVVPSVPQALNRLAAECRRRWAGRLVAVTGSVGKTSTKDMIAAVLSTRFRVHKSEGNLNNHYGLPLSLLRLQESHQVGVVELGMSHPGEIAELARIAQPDTGVVTCVAPVHLEFFLGIEGIARAKQELIQSLPAGGMAVLNADDPYVSRFANGFEGYRVSFGIEQPADFRATRLADLGLQGTTFCLQWEGECVETRVPLPGRHNVLNVLAAMATAHTFGIYPKEARAALASFRALKMRGEVQTVNGVTLVNDCYNSNPRALQFMLEVLRRTPAEGRRIAVLGEMLELGPASAALHREAGKQAAAAVDYLVAVRGDARHLLDGAVAAGLDPARAVFFDTPAAAAEHVSSLVLPGDVVLFKASRGVRLEEAVQRLTAAPAE